MLMHERILEKGRHHLYLDKVLLTFHYYNRESAVAFIIVYSRAVVGAE